MDAMPANMDRFIFGVERRDREVETIELELPPVEDVRSTEPILEWETYWHSQNIIETDRGSFQVYQTSEIDNNPLTIVFLHGAGHTAMTWSQSAFLLQHSARCIAMDYRGHGFTECEDEYALTNENLVEDLKSVLDILIEEPAPIILVGHSMGGALAIHASHEIENVVGLVVLDVVEGTAMNSLKFMRLIINKRPSTFPSVEHAIDWAYRTGEVHNLVSCRISIPTQIIENEMGNYRWRTNLLATEPFWREWFEGISNKFLSASAAKLLMISGTDRLDKPLTVGQMQGKFQMEVMATGIGHCIQEEVPMLLAKKLIAYIKRNQFVRMWRLNNSLNN